MNVSALSQHIREKIILGLLAGSCLAVFLMLLLLPAYERGTLQDLSQADSLILEELTNFHVSRNRIRTFEYPVTDDFTRKRYVVTLPANISQTHLHFELQQKLWRYRVDTIGYVNVPENHMKVLILFDDKIIRTLELRNDSDPSPR